MNYYWKKIYILLSVTLNLRKKVRASLYLCSLVTHIKSPMALTYIFHVFLTHFETLMKVN